MAGKETIRQWWKRMKDVPFHPEDEFMSYIEWSRNADFKKFDCWNKEKL